MFRRSLAELAMPFPNGWVHDEWLAMVAAAVDGMDVSSESIIGYRQHGANQIGVEKLSLVGRIARILEPGTARNHRLLQRAIVLPERLQTVGASPDRLEAARVKIVHEQMRSLLKPSRVLRIIPIVQELRSGRYRRFGRGIGDAVRDLLQPLGAPR